VKQPFERIVAEHGPAVLRVCRSVLAPQDAEDAWSETFLSALNAYPGLPEDANIEAWLVTIAYRRSIDVTRANARRPIAMEAPPESAARLESTSEEELWEAVRVLPDKQREAVAHRYFAGLPYKDIAAITGSNTDAVRRAAADGLKTLRRSYTTAEPTEGGRR
jgi:RNA polymerase sigma factor (sigma-70 family)